MERYYLKCTYCERPISVECERGDVYEIARLACPLCQHKDLPLTIMGRVHKTHLFTDGVKAACDARCTNAVGPKCDCLCGNVNHGTRKLVTYSKDNGTLTVTDKKLLEGNEEYLAKIEELARKKQSFRQMILAWLDTRFSAVVAKRNTVPYLESEDWRQWSLYQNYKYQMAKIEKMKTIKKKVAAYIDLFDKVRVS